MKEFDIAIDEILEVLSDSIEKDRPYIPDIPRDHSTYIGVVMNGVLNVISSDYSSTAKKGDIFLVKAGNIDISRALTDMVSYIYIDFVSPPISTSPETFDLVNHVREPELITNEFRRAEKISGERALSPDDPVPRDYLLDNKPHCFRKLRRHRVRLQVRADKTGDRVYKSAFSGGYKT